ncbi:MAG: hypothetical protein HEQ23_12575 [Tepidisphaera sp.]|jgi:uncharacterized membrane protein required for colicin V production
MVMNAFAIIIILISLYMWMLRGFFSAFIHLMCTVAAGAVAFAVFEPLAHYMLSSAGTRGFFAELQTGSAWAIALSVPFIISYAIFRAAIDATLRRNVFVNQTANYVGGGLCGGLAGVIMAGITIMSIGMLRLPADMGMFDYRAVQISANGSVQRGDALWVPADRLTSYLYSHLSGTTFYTDENLATYYPAMYATAGALRYAATNGENRARNTTPPGSFSIVQSYEVAPPQTVTGKARMEELTKDRFSAAQTGLLTFDGDPIDPASRLYGYVVNFNTAAKEKTGQVVVVNAQVALLVNNTVESKLIFPHAALLKAAPPNIDASDPRAKRKKFVEFARFGFSSGGDGKAFPSVGADADSKFGFEFLVPPGFTPKALYVKGIRADIADTNPGRVYSTALNRDMDIPDLMGGRSVANLDESLVYLMRQGNTNEKVIVDQIPESFGFSTSISIGIQLQRDTLQGGTIIPARGGGMIQDGEYRLNPRDAQTTGLDPNLKVDKYEPMENQVVCQLDVSMTNAWRFGERGFDNDKPVFLVDDKGRVYECIGYYYRDGDIIGVRYTPGTPLTGLEELPKNLSRSEPGQQCKLIFRVSKGAVITGLGIGDKLAIKWQPKFRLDMVQTLR